MKPMTAADLMVKDLTGKVIRYEAVHDDAMVAEVDGDYVRWSDYARLAARVAELEAALDRAERLAASRPYLQLDEALAAVRAVTRAATPADAPPHATQGEGTR